MPKIVEHYRINYRALQFTDIKKCAEFLERHYPKFGVLKVEECCGSHNIYVVRCKDVGRRPVEEHTCSR